MNGGRVIRMFALCLGIVALGATGTLALWQHGEISRLTAELARQAKGPAETNVEGAAKAPAGFTADDYAELQRLREEHRELLRLRNEVSLRQTQSSETNAGAAATSPAELARLREEHNDLLRLRSEISQLRQQGSDLETLRAANARLLQIVQDVNASNMMASAVSIRKQGSILGVQIVSDPPSQAYRGAVVGGFMPNAPAAQSDLKRGDIIIGVDGRSVENGAQLQAEMLTRAPGQTVVLDVMRGNVPVRVRVQTMAWPE